MCALIRNGYLGEFTDIYATTIGLTELHPEQANNEIRNALTHMARALIATTPADVLDQVKKAADHIERGKRDCLKISIIAIRKRLTATIHQIEITHGSVQMPVRQRLKAIERKRRDIFKAETRNESVTPALGDILADALDLEEFLETTYGNMSTFPSRWKRFKNRSQRYVKSVAAAVALAFVVGVMVPTDSAVGRAREHFWISVANIAFTSKVSIAEAEELNKIPAAAGEAEPNQPADKKAE